MSLLFVLVWMVGGSGAAVLSVVMRNDNPRVVAVGRMAFALLLAVDLLLAASAFSLATPSGSSYVTATRSIWWLTAIAGGIPMALFSGFAVRRGYAGRRLELAIAVLLTAALYLAFPLSFNAGNGRLTGLSRFEHGHHAVDIVVLLIPTLILLGAELLRHPEPTDEPTLLELARGVPRRTALGVAVALLVLLFFAGAGNTSFLIGLGVLVAVGSVIAAVKSRAEVRRVRRDIG